MNVNAFHLRADVDDLQKAYDKAIQAGETIFIWRGHELFVGYAKYLIEFAKQRFDTTPHPS